MFFLFVEFEIDYQFQIISDDLRFVNNCGNF